MTKYILIVITMLAVNGCATLTQHGGILYRSGQENKLARAVQLLEQGKTSAAEELLVAVCAEPGVPGVTDEALFRLGLLRLGPGREKSGMASARHDLERLKSEFPGSSWASSAAILDEFLEFTDSLQQQGRKMKESNLSLTKENRELHQSIEKLKNLELELGKGNRH